MQDNLYTGTEGRTGLMNGIKKVADAVGSTMGTGGSNGIIEMIESPGHLLTNDGYTIANSIVLADPIEDMGRKILLEAINRANKASGDGSSTTCVLTSAIIQEGMKRVMWSSSNDSSNALPQEPVPAMTIKKSLEECMDDIEQSIKDQTKSLFDPNTGVLDIKRLEQVATISAEDEQIGKTIAEIYSQIGQTGIIHWDISKTGEDHYSIGTGITIEGAGWFSPYMCDASDAGQNTMQIRIKNPQILITKQRISSAAEFNVVAASLDASKVKDLVVFCDDIEPLVVPDIIKTRQMRGFRIAIVKLPVIWKDEWFDDLALATGAIVIDPIAGIPLKEVSVKHLGTCGNIVITKEDTFLDGIKDLSAHVEMLKEQNTVHSDNRITRLNTKTARYFVGAFSDSALSHRRLKVEDAISASWHALNGGIVAGGGVALINCIIPVLATNSVGSQILSVALGEPLKQILANAGLPFSRSGIGGEIGFNSRTGEMVNMFDAGIIDPSTIVLNAVKNAISVAASIITASTVIIMPRQETIDFSALKQPQ